MPPANMGKNEGANQKCSMNNQYFHEMEGLHLFAQPVTGRENGTKAEAGCKAMENARRVLIEKGIPESEYNSYIGSAAENGDVELLSLLIAAGADINAKDSEGWAPLLLAYYEGHTECVRLLLAAPDINVNTEDEF